MPSTKTFLKRRAYKSPPNIEMHEVKAWWRAFSNLMALLNFTFKDHIILHWKQKLEKIENNGSVSVHFHWFSRLLKLTECGRSGFAGNVL